MSNEYLNNSVTVDLVSKQTRYSKW